MADTAPQLPSELPVLPLRRTVALPLTLQPLAVNRPVSIETVNRALGADRLVFLVLQNNEAEDPARRSASGRDHRCHSADGQGPERDQHHHRGTGPCAHHVVTRTGTSMRAQIVQLPEHSSTIEVEAHIRRIQELIEKALSLSTGLSEDLRGVVMNIDDPPRLAYVLASLIEMKPSDRRRCSRRTICSRSSRSSRRR